MRKKVLLFFVCALIHNNAFAERGVVRRFVDECKNRTLYYSPYVITPAIGATGALLGKKWLPASLSAATVYGLYAWLSTWADIVNIKHKYQGRTRPTDFWKESPYQEKTLFCRWRQLDDQFGDGVYWPTGWWLKAHEEEIEEKLLQDIYAGRIRLSYRGTPTPKDVIAAINEEMNQLSGDLLYMRRYTDVYRRYGQPEAFVPDRSDMRVFWPNYNRASQLYVELAMMLGRLVVLQEIVAGLCAKTGGNRWPRLKG